MQHHNITMSYVTVLISFCDLNIHISKNALSACTNLIPIWLPHEVEQIASFHQFKHNEGWIIVDAYSQDTEYILMVKVAGYDKAQGQQWQYPTNYTLDDTILQTTVALLKYVNICIVFIIKLPAWDYTSQRK